MGLKCDRLTETMQTDASRAKKGTLTLPRNVVQWLHIFEFTHLPHAHFMQLAIQ